MNNILSVKMTVRIISLRKVRTDPSLNGQKYELTCTDGDKTFVFSTAASKAAEFFDELYREMIIFTDYTPVKEISYLPRTLMVLGAY